jgi:hypothetical protein
VFFQFNSRISFSNINPKYKIHTLLYVELCLWALSVFIVKWNYAHEAECRSGASLIWLPSPSPWREKPGATPTAGKALAPTLLLGQGFPLRALAAAGLLHNSSSAESILSLPDIPHHPRRKHFPLCSNPSTLQVPKGHTLAIRSQSPGYNLKYTFTKRLSAQH